MLWLWYQLTVAAAVAAMLATSALCSPQTLLLVIAAVTTVATCVFIGDPAKRDDAHAVGGFVKVLCTLPLGLGSLAGYQCIPLHLQKRYRAAFVWYINIAVLGNIVGMVLLPHGGTIRGWTAKGACVALSAWLASEMSRHCWQTQPPLHPLGCERRPLLLFNASPLPWVLTHAAYRAAMMTLPSFDGGRYVLMEALSLTAMCWLHRSWSRHDGGEYPLSYFFGMGDTIVVATMGAVSHIADSVLLADDVLAMPYPLDGLSTDALDRLIVPVHVAVMLVAGWNARRGWVAR